MFKKLLTGSASMTLRAAAMLAMLTALAGVSLAAPPDLGAPEIDPGSMVGALTLLSGGVAMLTSRRKSK